MLFCVNAHASEDKWVVETIAYEASSEPFEGQVAVASVIKTRMKERNQTSKEVVLAKSQFSCWKDGKPTQKRKLTAKELYIARKAWDEAKVGKANLYCTKAVADKTWWTKSPKVHFIKTIGNHNFYKE